MDSNFDQLLIYGINPIIKILTTRPKDTKQIYFLSSSLNTSQKKILNIANKNKIKINYIENDKSDFLFKELNCKNKIAHQKVFATIKVKPELNFDEYIKNESSNFCVILDGVTDPNNLGAIIRNLSAFGVDLLILPKNRSAKIDATVYKTSAGEIEEINIALVNNLSSTVKKLKENGFWIYAFEEDASQSIWDTDFSGKVVCVLGGESTGVRRLVKENCDFLLKIPMKNGVQSLNVSSSSSIMCYEVYKNKLKNK